jgi:hypothetical protein
VEVDLTQYSTPQLMKLYSSVQKALLERGVTPPAAGGKIQASNYERAKAALTAQGYSSFFWVDENGGADFTAHHSTGKDSLRIQLKTRAGFWRQYVGKNVMICAVTSDGVYLYPHDEMLGKHVSRFQHCGSWTDNGVQYWPQPPAWVREWLAPHKLKEASPTLVA